MNKPRALVDTNMLVYAADSESPFHQKARKFLEDNALVVDFVLSIQNLTEFYAVVTNPKKFTTPLRPAEARKEIGRFISDGFYTIIAPAAKTPATLVGLLEKYPAKGAEVHDVNLSATAISNTIDTIYTADTKVFSRLGLLAVNPLA
jgi:predicted nucleic acid-binding protein